MTIPRIASYALPAADDLPANRVDWQPDPQRAVLLIHDMQEYFVRFFAPASAPVPQLIAHITRLRDAADRAGVPVVYTAQPAEQSLAERGLLQPWWGPGITQQPDQVGIVGALAPRPHDTVLVKWRYSAFARSDLRQRLHTWGRDQLIVCGVYAHIGCLMTAADAFMQDVQPFLVGDAVADFSAGEHRQALTYVAGRCGVVASTADVVQALSPRAALPASRDALRAEVAALLDVPAHELRFDDHLLDAGLDSIRLMTLVERWRRAGAELAFVDLAEDPTLARWWSLLQPAQVA